jgi:hypothetical protein
LLKLQKAGSSDKIRELKDKYKKDAEDWEKKILELNSEIRHLRDQHEDDIENLMDKHEDELRNIKKAND